LKVLERKKLDRWIDIKVLSKVLGLYLKKVDFIILEGKTLTIYKNILKKYDETLALWISCSDEVAIRRVSEREGITLEEAKRRVEKRKIEDYRRYKKAYSLEFPKDFKVKADFVIDTTYLDGLNKYKRFVEDFWKYILSI